jgi:hypothetical protein
MKNSGLNSTAFMEKLSFRLKALVLVRSKSNVTYGICIYYLQPTNTVTT